MRPTALRRRHVEHMFTTSKGRGRPDSLWRSLHPEIYYTLLVKNVSAYICILRTVALVRVVGHALRIRGVDVPIGTFYRIIVILLSVFIFDMSEIRFSEFGNRAYS